MVEEERAGVDKLDSEKDNLLTALVRASNAASQGKERSSLSHDEIMGNLFVYNVAGHDTTANTICYALYVLAAQPGYQDWVGQEIDSVFAGNDKVKTWEYEKAFPKLKRCLALMVSLSPRPAVSPTHTHSTKLSVCTDQLSSYRDTLVRDLQL
jgi:cytochrome P450